MPLNLCTLAEKKFCHKEGYIPWKTFKKNRSEGNVTMCLNCGCQFGSGGDLKKHKSKSYHWCMSIPEHWLLIVGEEMIPFTAFECNAINHLF